VEEVTDEPLYRDRVCGIDIGKAEMAVTIRVPSDKDPARRASETRSFATTKRGVLALADWLRSWQVPAVVMEATGIIRGANGMNQTSPRSARRGRVCQRSSDEGAAGPAASWARTWPLKGQAASGQVGVAYASRRDAPSRTCFR